MKRPTPCFAILVMLTVACALIAACQPPPRFDLAFSTPKGEPVYIERAIYDDTRAGLGGIMTCCWKMAGSVNILSRPYPPVPKKVFIRWFNYKQQTYYEATAFLAEDTEKQLRRLRKVNLSSHKLTTGVKPDGGVVVWISNGFYEKSGTWIEVARAQGHVAEGDPAAYSTHTEDMRKRGEIP